MECCAVCRQRAGGVPLPGGDAASRGPAAGPAQHQTSQVAHLCNWYFVGLCLVLYHMFHTQKTYIWCSTTRFTHRRPISGVLPHVSHTEDLYLVLYHTFHTQKTYIWCSTTRFTHRWLYLVFYHTFHTQKAMFDTCRPISGVLPMFDTCRLIYGAGVLPVFDTCRLINGVLPMFDTCRTISGVLPMFDTCRRIWCLTHV